MLHTLLPLSERKALKAEYRVRMAIVLCFMLCLAGIIGIASLFPAFIRASTEEKTALNTIASLKKDKDQSGLSKIESDFSNSAVLLSALAKDSAEPQLDSLIQKIVSMRGPLVINSISLSSQSAGSVDVVLQGTAPTRDSLTTFKGKLESAAPGNKVDLPVDELRSPSNVQFSLTVHWITP